jgi:hypothetical protein
MMHSISSGCIWPVFGSTWIWNNLQLQLHNNIKHGMILRFLVYLNTGMLCYLHGSTESNEKWKVSHEWCAEGRGRSDLRNYTRICFERMRNIMINRSQKSKSLWLSTILQRHVRWGVKVKFKTFQVSALNGGKCCTSCFCCSNPWKRSQHLSDTRSGKLLNTVGDGKEKNSNTAGKITIVLTCWWCHT